MMVFMSYSPCTGAQHSGRSSGRQYGAPRAAPESGNQISGRETEMIRGKGRGDEGSGPLEPDGSSQPGDIARLRMDGGQPPAQRERQLGMAAHDEVEAMRPDQGVDL